MISLDQLHTRGLVHVDYPPNIRSAVERAVTSWQLFCALPREIKKRFIYLDEGNLDGAGYELKEEKGSTKDLKENFHVTLGAIARLRATEAEVPDRNVLGFIDGAEDLVDLIAPFILEFARAIEDEYGLPGFSKEVNEGKENWILRYLHYFGNREEGEEIATAHADKCGFTLHLYESAPGLQYLEIVPTAATRQWREMPVSAGRTVIIPSMQLQHKSGARLKALCHRVVATHDTAVTGRYSVVCFVPLTKTPKYDKGARGRLQEFAPGFNYDMSPKDFSELFR